MSGPKAEDFRNMAEAAKYDLRRLMSIGDTHEAHRNADQVLCLLLIGAGFEDVVEEYKKLKAGALPDGWLF